MKSPWAWSAEQDAIIIANIGTHSYEKLGAMLGKPRSSVSDRAKKLGLVRPGTHPDEAMAKRVASTRATKERRKVECPSTPWPAINTNEYAALNGRRYDDAPASVRNLLGNGALVMISRRAAFRYEGSACGNSSQLCAP